MAINLEFKNIKDLKNEVFSNPDLKQQFIAEPIKTLDLVADKSPLETDKWIYRIVVLALGITIVSIAIGIIIIMSVNSNFSDKGNTILTALGSAAIGTLAGLLAPSPKTN